MWGARATHSPQPVQLFLLTAIRISRRGKMPLVACSIWSRSVNAVFIASYPSCNSSSTCEKLNQLMCDTAGRTSNNGGEVQCSNVCCCCSCIIMDAARMKIDANPCADTLESTGTSAMPTSIAINASTSSAAIETGRLSVVPPSMQVRPPTTPGGKKPGRAQLA